MEEPYRKGLNDLDNHNGVITHLEPEILQCKVKQALGSIAANKANGGDGILLKILKKIKKKKASLNMSKFGKPSIGHRTGKGQSSSHFPRRAVVKNIQTTGQLCTLPMLVKLCSKLFKPGFSST